MARPNPVIMERNHIAGGRSSESKINGNIAITVKPRPTSVTIPPMRIKPSPGGDGVGLVTPPPYG